MPIVTNPTAGDLHVKTPLTNFSQKFMQDSDRFVASKASPNSPSVKQADLYYVFDRSDFFRDEAKERADGTESAGGSFNLSTQPYFCKVFAFHKDVTDRQRANQDSQVRLDQSATQYVTTKMMIRREKLFSEAFMVGSIWFNGGAAASAGQNVDWSAALSDPIADVRTAKRGVLQRTGYMPNKMTITQLGFDTLMENDAILARISGGALNGNPAIVNLALLAQLFELQNIFIMGAIENTGAEGDGSSLNQNETNVFIGADNCLLYYAPDSIGIEEPTAMVHFSWTGLHGNTDDGGRIKKFRMDHLGADRIEGEMSVDYRVTAPELGHLFLTVSAA